MSNYKQLSVMAFILAISAQAYAAEDITSATPVTDQQIPAAVSTGNDTGALSDTAKNTATRKNRMDSFSVEFYDDVELANTAADRLEEGMITISTTRYVDNVNDTERVIEIASLKEKKNEDSVDAPDNVSTSEKQPAEQRLEQASEDKAQPSEISSQTPIATETVDTAEALRNKIDASSVIADAEKDLDAASSVISNKEKITTIDVTKSVQDPPRNVSSKIMQKADENVREIEKKQAEIERARLADEEQKRLADEAIEAEARAKLEELEAQEKAEAEAKAKAEEEAKLKAEADAKAKAEEEAKLKAEADAKAKAEEEAKLKAEADAKAKAEEEAKLKAEADAKAKAEEEAKLKAEADAKAKAEEAKLKAEADAKAKAETQSATSREITEAELYSEELDKLFPLPTKDTSSAKNVDMNAFNGVLKVKRGMGLEQIGSNLANKVFGVSKYQAAVAVYRRNPKMFSNKAPVYPFSGMLLKVPTKEQMALESDSTYFDILMRGQGIISANSLPKLQPEKNSKSYDEQLKKVLEQRKNYLLNK